MAVYLRMQLYSLIFSLLLHIGLRRYICVLIEKENREKWGQWGRKCVQKEQKSASWENRRGLGRKTKQTRKKRRQGGGKKARLREKQMPSASVYAYNEGEYCFVLQPRWTNKLKRNCEQITKLTTYKTYNCHFLPKCQKKTKYYYKKIIH